MRRLGLLAALTALVLLSVAAPAAARGGMPEPKTERGAIIEDIYFQIFVAGTIVFVLVFALLAWVILRYREGSGHGRATHERERHNLKAEMLWTGVPLLVVLWVGLIAYQGLAKLDQDLTAEDAALEVGIEASQWNWEAKYPGGVSMFADPSSADGSVSDSKHFLVPAGVPILWNVTGIETGVIHALHLADDNHATIHLVDANPTGPHKYNTFVSVLPEGRYLIQCREMCLNPGHAYMRAVVDAVPQAQYDHWLKGKALEVGAELVAPFSVQVGAKGYASPGEQTVVVGSRVVAEVTNGGAAPLTVSAPGGQAITVAPGGRDWIAFDVPDAGPAVLQVGDVQVPFKGIVAEQKEVSLGAYKLIPDALDVDAGTTYLIVVQNVHDTAHNLYIGDLDARAVTASSATIGPGATARFLYTPDATGTVDMWCDVPGHADQGMVGDVHIH